MSKVLKFKRPRRRRNHEEERVKRLRIVASRLGYELVRPWCAAKRDIPGHGPYLLVPHHSGLNIDEVEQILASKGRRD